MKIRKREMTEGIEQPNQGKIRTIGEKKTYKDLGIIKHAEMKKKMKIKNEYLWRTRKLYET